MFHRILVPLDGSSRAECALPVAARLAHASGGAVILLRVVSSSIQFQTAMGLETNLVQSVTDADFAEGEQYLAGLAISPDLRGIPTETVVLLGRTAPTILSVAESSHAEVIVMCSHGYTGVKRWVLGSVAEKVVHSASIPVLLLGEKGLLPMGPHVDDTGPLRVLVPLDGSTHAKAALVPAAYLVAALASAEQGAMHVMRVAKPSPTSREEEQQEERERVLHRAKRYLSATTEQLREGLVAHPIADYKLPVTWSVAVDTDVAEAIIRVAENGEDAEGAGVFGGCDIIAMATHGRGGLQRWAMGSVTERVLHATKLPLLIVRPSAIMKINHSTTERATMETLQS